LILCRCICRESSKFQESLEGFNEERFKEVKCTKEVCPAGLLGQLYWMVVRLIT
jgi:hypothetical protein